MTQTTDAKPERDQRSDLKLAVFGATGGIGQSLVRRAIQAGHRVRVLVRNADKFKAWAAEQAWTDEDRARLQVETGDATDVGDVQRVVRGVDAVLCSLGAPATSRSRRSLSGNRNHLECNGEGRREPYCRRLGVRG